MESSETYSIYFGEGTPLSGNVIMPIDREFLESYGSDEIGDARVKAEISYQRKGMRAELSVRLTGEVKVQCDRCLDDLWMPVDFEAALKAIPEGQESGDDDDDIVFIDTETSSVSLGEYLYESLILCLPTQRVHERIEDCDQEMIERFRIVTEEEFDRIASGGNKLADNPEMQKLSRMQEDK